MAGPVVLAFVALAASGALAAENTVITVDIRESHDRIEPDPKTDIVLDYEYVVTLAPNRNISETETISSTRSHSVTVSPHAPDNQAVLGGETSRVSWRVLSPHKLERIAAGLKYYVVVWDVEIGADNRRAIDVKYVAQDGMDYVLMGYRGGVQKAKLPRLLGASCFIN